MPERATALSADSKGLPIELRVLKILDDPKGIDTLLAGKVVEPLLGARLTAALVLTALAAAAARGR